MRPRIVLVGTGRFGGNHLRNLMELDKKRIIEFVGVADVDKKALEKIQKKYKIPTSNDYLDFLDKADAFDIVTPAFTHFEIVNRLLSKGKHVFVEKPLALTYKDSIKLVNLARNSNLILQVGLIFRYNKSVEILKKLTMEELPYFVTGRFLQATEPKTDVGAIFNYLHHFDIIENLFGKKIKSILAKPNLISKKTNLETNVTVFIEFKNNLKIILTLGWIPVGKFRTIEFFSKSKHVKCDLMNQKIDIIQENKPVKIIQCKFPEPLNLELKEFVKCIKNKKHPVANGKIGAEVVKIAELATKSLRTQKPIFL